MRIVIAEDQFLLRQGLENLLPATVLRLLPPWTMGRRSRMRCSLTAQMLH